MPRTRMQRPIKYRDRKDRVWSVAEVAVLKVVSPAIDGPNLALVIRFEHMGEQRFARWLGDTDWREPAALHRLFESDARLCLTAIGGSEMSGTACTHKGIMNSLTRCVRPPVSGVNRSGNRFARQWFQGAPIQRSARARAQSVEELQCLGRILSGRVSEDENSKPRPSQ